MRVRDRNKWVALVKTIKITYPDVSVRVEVVAAGAVFYGDPLRVGFNLYGLKDTQSEFTATLSPAVGPNFYHLADVRHWPGKEAAKKFLAALWCFFMFHEGLETIKDGYGRYLNPHSPEAEPVLHKRLLQNMNNIGWMNKWLDGRVPVTKPAKSRRKSA